MIGKLLQRKSMTDLWGMRRFGGLIQNPCACLHGSACQEHMGHPQMCVAIACIVE